MVGEQQLQNGNCYNIMDIAALSMGLSQMKLAQQASISIMKLAMDTAEVQAAEMTEMAEQSLAPYVGGNLDISL